MQITTFTPNPSGGYDHTRHDMTGRTLDETYDKAYRLADDPTVEIVRIHWDGGCSTVKG